jgi:hypothetical protein
MLKYKKSKNGNNPLLVWFDNDFEIESKYYLEYCVLFYNSSYLEFTRCLFSEFVFSYMMLRYAKIVQNTSYVKFIKISYSAMDYFILYQRY